MESRKKWHCSMCRAGIETQTWRMDGDTAGEGEGGGN